MDFAERLRRLDRAVLGPVGPGDRKLLAWFLVGASAVVPLAVATASLSGLWWSALFLAPAAGIALRLPADERRPALAVLGGPLLALGLLCCLSSLLLGLSRPGDVSIRDECQRSSLSVYRDPLPEVLDDLSGQVFGRICNKDAVSRVHRALGLLSAGVLATSTGLVLRHRRARG